MLRRITVLRGVELDKLQQLADALTEVRYEFGHYIYRQGDTIDHFYFVLRGECEVTSSSDPNAAGGADGNQESEALIKCIYEREFFGERLLLEPNASFSRFNVVVCSKKATLLRLSKAQFEEVLGPLDALTTAYNTRYEASMAVSVVGGAGADIPGQLTSIPSKFNHIKLLSLVAQDSVGSLVLGTYGAMLPNLTVRTFLLTDVDEQNRSNTVLNSVDICKLIAFSSDPEVTGCPFIPRLVCLFRQLNALHLVFNKATSCDLAFVVAKMGTDPGRDSVVTKPVLHHRQLLSSDTIQYVAASIVDALAALHKLGIVYRNVQPEGLQVDTSGRLLLLDYTVSKIVAAGSRTFTLCGATNYLAPEQISLTGHSTEVDLWALGVLLYELCTAGGNPFRSSSELQTYQKITSLGSKDFPKVVLDKQAAGSKPASGFALGGAKSSPLESLIQALVVPNPTSRLGAGSGGMDALRSHVYFSGINWKTLGRPGGTGSPLELYAVAERDALITAAAAEVEAVDNPTSSINTLPTEVSDAWNVSYVGSGWEQEIDVSSPI